MSDYTRGREPACPLKYPGCKGIIRNRGSASCFPCSQYKRTIDQPRVTVEPPRAAPEDLPTAILALLKKGSLALDETADALHATPGQVLDTILALQRAGQNVHQLGERWSLEKAPVPQQGRSFIYTSRPDHTFTFGIASDNHLGSKYERLDVLNSLYDWFAARGVDRVLNCGNWIDGEDEKNKHDLAVHGLEPQIDYFVKHYPARTGLTTYAVWGEDHEGWFARRESIDVGRFAERRMRDAGRTDWVDLGFMEAALDLVNASSGQSTKMLAMHPGGGTAYALSYRPQKLVESLQGGEKPAAILIGHYHKISVNLIRNVWAIQVGCTQDQTPFMRKIPTEPHVGGFIVTFTQDPETGALTGCVPEMRIYFNRGYQNDRWSKSGASVLPDRYFVGPQ
jgi:hypothetical protein